MTQNVLTCDSLVITCIDFRLPHFITDYMDERGLRGDYDHFILPGCSIARKKDHWFETLEDVVDIAVHNHEIKRVFMIDHHDCAAYRLICGEHTSREHEVEMHRHNATIQKEWLSKKFPHLEIECLMMDLDGKVYTYPEAQAYSTSTA